MLFISWIGRQFERTLVVALIICVLITCLAAWLVDQREERQRAAEMQRERVRFQYWKLGEDHLLERYRIDPDDALERLRRP